MGSSSSYARSTPKLMLGNWKKYQFCLLYYQKWIKVKIEHITLSVFQMFPPIKGINLCVVTKGADHLSQHLEDETH